MFKLFKLVVLVSALCSSMVMAEGQKVAVVDLTRAIFGTEVAKLRTQQMSDGSEYTALQAKFESINADINAMKKDADNKSATWSQEQGADYKKKVEYLLADRELVIRKLKAESQALRGSIVNELQSKTEEVLSEIVKEEGIQLLLRAESVIVASPDLDITAKVTDRLNKKTK